MPRVEDPNERMIEQIEEILEEDDREHRKPAVLRVTRPVRRPDRKRRIQLRRGWLTVTPEKLLAAGLILLVAGAFGRSAAVPLAVTGFVIAAAGYYWMIRTGRRGGGHAATRAPSKSAQYWRGRKIEPRAPVKKRDGNILEFPDSRPNRIRRLFGRKR